MYRRRKESVAEVCRTFGISKPTLYAYVREAGT
jgi:transposase-like protein